MSNYMLESDEDKKWADDRVAEGKLQYPCSIELVQELNGPQPYTHIEHYMGYDYPTLKDDSLVKFICPSCKTDKLIVYYRAGAYETRARCTSCDGIDFCVHSG